MDPISFPLIVELRDIFGHHITLRNHHNRNDPSFAEKTVSSTAAMISLGTSYNNFLSAIYWATQSHLCTTASRLTTEDTSEIFRETTIDHVLASWSKDFKPSNTTITEENCKAVLQALHARMVEDVVLVKMKVVVTQAEGAEVLLST